MTLIILIHYALRHSGLCGDLPSLSHSFAHVSVQTLYIHTHTRADTSLHTQSQGASYLLEFSSEQQFVSVFLVVCQKGGVCGWREVDGGKRRQELNVIWISSVLCRLTTEICCVSGNSDSNQ